MVLSPKTIIFQKNVPLNFIYIYMYCPPKLPFFIRNVPLNLTICYIYLYVLILFANTLTSKKLSNTPPYFYTMSGHLFFTICGQEVHTPLISQVLDMI